MHMRTRLRRFLFPAVSVAVRRLTEASVAEPNSHCGGRPGSGAPPLASEFEAPDGIVIVAMLDGEEIGLYGTSGFERIPCWGPYVTNEQSLCFELGR